MSNPGKKFEENWADSYKGIYHLRLKDGTKWDRSENSSFQPSNPCDLIQFRPPYLWMLELKSTVGSSMSFHGARPWEKSNIKYTIKPNQVKDLMKYSKYENVICGFILNFRERVLKTATHPHQTYFVSIDNFVNFAQGAGKSSITAEDCKEIGVSIEHRLKKVNYEYNIEKLINEVTIF
jgi:hypothetical protein